MIQIGFHNAAELLFQNQLVRQALPQYKHLFDSWSMSQKVTHLRSLGMRSVIDFLNSVTQEDLQKLSEIFKIPVTIAKPEINPFRNIVSDIDNLEFMMPQFSNAMDFVLYRKGKNVSVLINTGSLQ